MYKQLTREQRYAIYLGLKEKKTKTAIARQINVSVSTVCREIKRNTNRHGRYLYLEAHEVAMYRRERTTTNRKIKYHVMQDAIKLLKEEQWSPEQIAAIMTRNGQKISHESIYRHIRKHPELKEYCRNKLKYRHHKKMPKATKATNIPNRVSIHMRPAEADGSRFGDWELDLIVGKNQKSCLVTLVERSTSYVIIKRLNSKNHNEVKEAVIQMLWAYANSNAIKTITTDNGVEFYDHQEIAKKLKTKIFFTDSYASWQKGAIENSNKLIRQYFPKGTDFRLISDKQVKDIQYKLNKRPRKKLLFEKPLVRFFNSIT